MLSASPHPPTLSLSASATCAHSIRSSSRIIHAQYLSECSFPSAKRNKHRIGGCVTYVEAGSMIEFETDLDNKNMVKIGSVWSKDKARKRILEKFIFLEVFWVNFFVLLELSENLRKFQIFYKKKWFIEIAGNLKFISFSDFFKKKFFRKNWFFVINCWNSLKFQVEKIQKKNFFSYYKNHWKFKKKMNLVQKLLKKYLKIS